MSKSWAYGACTVLGVHALWFGLIFLESRADWFMAGIVAMSFVTMNVAGLGAFITAMTAPRRGFLLGLTMAPLSALLGTGSNLLFAAGGNRVDFSGFYDNFGLFTVSLAYGIFVCAVGGGIGLWMAQDNDNRDGRAAAVPAKPDASQPLEPFIPDPGTSLPPASRGLSPPAGHI
jgi:hypothetical protein